MKINDFCDELYRYIFQALDSEDIHSSECGVGGDVAASIATKASELVRALLMGEPDQKRVVVRVTLENGNHWVTPINTDLEGARRYFFAANENGGLEQSDETLSKVVSVEDDTQ